MKRTKAFDTTAALAQMAEANTESSTNFPSLKRNHRPPICCGARALLTLFRQLETIRKPLGENRTTTFQWLFLVPLKGGRWHIIPQLAVYTTYIPLIYCLLGGLYATYHLLGEPFQQPLNLLSIHVTAWHESAVRIYGDPPSLQTCWKVHKASISDGSWVMQYNDWLVVSTHLKNISQNGNLPQIGVKIKNVWNHHLDDIAVAVRKNFVQNPVDVSTNVKITKSQDWNWLVVEPTHLKNMRTVKLQ